jgi:hypothetical protein
MTLVQAGRRIGPRPQIALYGEAQEGHAIVIGVIYAGLYMTRIETGDYEQPQRVHHPWPCPDPRSRLSCCDGRGIPKQATVMRLAASHMNLERKCEPDFTSSRISGVGGR